MNIVPINPPVESSPFQSPFNRTEKARQSTESYHLERLPEQKYVEINITTPTPSMRKGKTNFSSISECVYSAFTHARLSDWSRIEERREEKREREKELIPPCHRSCHNNHSKDRYENENFDVCESYITSFRSLERKREKASDIHFVVGVISFSNGPRTSLLLAKNCSFIHQHRETCRYWSIRKICQILHAYQRDSLFLAFLFLLHRRRLFCWN